MANKNIPLVDLKAQFDFIKGEIYEAIKQVLESQCFVMGEEVRLFEKEFADFCGARHCISVASGTAALHLALVACGIGEGDEVITVPNTFIATTEAISYARAKIVFVDIDPATYTIDVDQLEQSITKRTKAIIPVHLFGHPANMKRIIEIAQKYKLKVIEDVAQAHGAKLHGQSVGTFGDIGCFSFFPAKNLGAYGDAGAIITNNDVFAKHIRLLCNHGREKKYEHEIEGFNYRLDTLQAAVLRVKLKYLPQWIEARRKRALYYKELLHNLPLIIPQEAPGCYHAYHLYVIQAQKRDIIRTSLSQQGIETGIHYPLPLHLQNAYRYLNHCKGDFPVTEACANSIISLPLYPELSDRDQYDVAQTIHKVLSFEQARKAITIGGTN